jgi:GNAT superfamily N-acetyltransferase
VKPNIQYRIVEVLSEAQIQQLHSLYQGEWWTAKRSMADVRTVLDHSDFIFGVVTVDSQQLVGFTRVLSDRVFKALLFDVIVHPEHRGAGLGSILMKHILQHPVLSRVRHVELYCLPERREFYRRHGFTADLGELQLMRRVNERQESA